MDKKARINELLKRLDDLEKKPGGLLGRIETILQEQDTMKPVSLGQLNETVAKVAEEPEAKRVLELLSKAKEETDTSLQELREAVAKDVEEVLEGLSSVEKGGARMTAEQVRMAREELASRIERTEKGTQDTLKLLRKSATRDDLRAVVRSFSSEVKDVQKILKSVALMEHLRAIESGFAEKERAILNKQALIQAEVDYVRQELSNLPQDQSADIRKELAALENRIGRRLANIGGGNQNRNISVGGNSSTLSKYTDINFVAGSNIGIAVSTNDVTKVTNFTLTATVPATAPGLAFASVSGTVDAVNPTFGYPSSPQAIIGDGVTYFEGNGYTYAASVITMDVPPSQYIKAFIQT